MVDKDINRRKYLSGISSVGIGGLGLSKITTAAAESSDPIEELSGRKAKKTISKARSDRDFNNLKSALSADEVDLRLESESAYKITQIDAGEEQSFRAAIFKYTNEEEDSIEIAVPIDKNSTQPAKALLIKDGDGESLVKITEYVNGSKAENQGSKLESNSTDSTENVSATIEEISTNGTVVTKESMEFSQNSVSTDSISNSVEAKIPDEKCNTGQQMPCWGCKDLVSAVNVVSCGTAIWLICASIGVASGGLGGLACGISVGLVCWAIHHYGTNNPTEVCKKVCACP